MATELRRYLVSPTTRQLTALLRDANYLDTQAIGLTADLDRVRAVFREFQGNDDTPSQIARARLDGELIEPLHEALSNLSRRAATDMSLWHWLCIAELQDFVWYRWYGRVPADFSGVISPSLEERFLGRSTLRGISRNALARLWWCGETLWSAEDGYDLARAVISSQDFFQAVFERELGLYVPAARACVRALRNSSEDARRAATRRLNHYFTTLVAEALDEDQIANVLLGGSND